jgi:hypothetical protein
VRHDGKKSSFAILGIGFASQIPKQRRTVLRNVCTDDEAIHVRIDGGELIFDK